MTENVRVSGAGGTGLPPTGQADFAKVIKYLEAVGKSNELEHIQEIAQKISDESTRAERQRRKMVTARRSEDRAEVLAKQTRTAPSAKHALEEMQNLYTLLARAGVSKEFEAGKLTQSDLTNLKELRKNFLSMIGKLFKEGKIDKPTYLAILKDYKGFLKDLIAANTKSTPQLQEQLNRLKTQLAKYKQMAKTETTLQNLLGRFSKSIAKGKFPTGSELEELISTLMSLGKQAKDLPPSLQNQLNTLLSDLGNVKGRGVSMSGYLVEAQIYLLMQEYGKTHKQPFNKADLQAYIKKKIGEMKGQLGGYSNVFFKKFFDEMEDYASDLSKTPQSGIPFLDEGNIHADFLSELSEETGDVFTAKGARWIGENYVATTEETIGSTQNEISALENDTVAFQGQLSEVDAKLPDLRGGGKPLEPEMKVAMRFLQETLQTFGPSEALGRVDKMDPNNLSSSDIAWIGQELVKVGPKATEMKSEGHINGKTYVRILKNMHAMTQQMIQANETQIQGPDAPESKAGKGQLEKVGTALKTAAQNIDNKISSSGSLADQFGHTVLGKGGFMAREQQYLLNLAGMFALFNFGAQMGNALLGIIKGWTNASNDFNLNDWIAENFGQKNTYDETKTKINDEINSANAYLSQLISLIKTIEADEDKVNGKISHLKKEYKGGKISKSEYRKKLGELDKLAKQLNGYLHNAETTKANLNKLITTLDDIKNNLRETSDGKWYIKGWGGKNGLGNRLANGENYVKNGDPKEDKKWPGGFAKIYGEVNADQEDCQSESTIAQLTLEMKMTEMQQMWTVVSTALQILFASYKAFTQGIYR